MISTHRKDGFSISITVGNHSLLSDVKPSLGGKDEGPDPHEILEAALGACTSITVQMYANHKGWKLTSCNADVKFIQEDKDAIVIERSIGLEGDLDAAQKQRLFEIAEKCPIHLVLTRGAKITSTLKN